MRAKSAGKSSEPLAANNIEFIPRRRQDIDFIFLIANPRQARLIKPTQLLFRSRCACIRLTSVFDGLNGSTDNRDLEGIWFADAPWLLENGSLKQIDGKLRAAQGSSQRPQGTRCRQFQAVPPP